MLDGGPVPSRKHKNAREGNEQFPPGVSNAVIGRDAIETRAVRKIGRVVGGGTEVRVLRRWWS